MKFIYLLNTDVSLANFIKVSTVPTSKSLSFKKEY